jgi:hypothetical protein
MTLAASGQPNKMLTLTCAPLAEPDPVKARALLHKAWRALRLQIARELAKPSKLRWRGGLKVARRRPAGPKGLSDAPVQRKNPPALPYFAVVERHKSGRPHLHILLRCDYIPQPWISRQMQRLAGSPVCDIRAVQGTKQAAAYVAKYIGKAPAKFGNSRAYWYSANWSPAKASGDQADVKQTAFFSVAPRSWHETRQEVEHLRPIIDLTPDGWFSLSPRAAPLGAYTISGRYGALFPRDGPNGR